MDYLFLREDTILTNDDLQEIQQLAGVTPERLLQVARRNCVVIAKDLNAKGRYAIIGVACLSIIETLTHDAGLIEKAFVDPNVFVDPRYVDCDISLELIKKLLERGLELGYERVKYQAEEVEDFLEEADPRDFRRRPKPIGQKGIKAPIIS